MPSKEYGFLASKEASKLIKFPLANKEDVPLASKEASKDNLWPPKIMIRYFVTISTYYVYIVLHI